MKVQLLLVSSTLRQTIQNKNFDNQNQLIGPFTMLVRVLLPVWALAGLGKALPTLELDEPAADILHDRMLSQPQHSRPAGSQYTDTVCYFLACVVVN